VASRGRTIKEAKKNLQEAVELYLEDVLEAGDEQEFIPRPALMEEWIKSYLRLLCQRGLSLRR
jgi:predicted RNase H-like HicB family nuclease